MQSCLSNITYKDQIIKYPKGISDQVIKHKHYRAFLLFLQLKPIYVSSTILNDAGKIPYQKIAAYCGLSVSGVRGKIKQLKKYKLLHTDRDKNIHLASYKTFVSLFRPQYLRRMRKFRYKNIAGADILIRTAAMQENFKKQEYTLKNKIIQKELSITINGSANAHKDRIKQPKINIAERDCHKDIRTDLSKSAVRKIKRQIRADYEHHLHRYKRKYLQELEYINNALPEINPYVTLSCAGIGRLFGIGSSTGHYQRQRMAKATVIEVKPTLPCKINSLDPYTKQHVQSQGTNVYSYHYPVKRSRMGMEEKFFLHLADNITINSSFIYENAKN